MNLRYLTQRIVSCYTHKMAIVRDHRLCDVISPYTQTARKKALVKKNFENLPLIIPFQDIYLYEK